MKNFILLLFSLIPTISNSQDCKEPCKIKTYLVKECHCPPSSSTGGGGGIVFEKGEADMLFYLLLEKLEEDEKKLFLRKFDNREKERITRLSDLDIDVEELDYESLRSTIISNELHHKLEQIDQESINNTDQKEIEKVLKNIDKKDKKINEFNSQKLDEYKKIDEIIDQYNNVLEEKSSEYKRN